MDSPNIYEQIKEERGKIKNLSIEISILSEKPISREMKAKETELHDRLQYRLAELELAGMREKRRTMEKLISLIKKDVLR